jgi:hypothetical protein
VLLEGADAEGAFAGLFGLMAYAYFAHIAPTWAPVWSPWVSVGHVDRLCGRLCDLQWWCLSGFGVWALTMILWNYWLAILTHPGSPPSDAPEALRGRVEKLSPPVLRSGLEPREGGDFSSIDRLTGQWKPPRAHRDQVTKDVILRFDHFCPWIGNAVGYRNYPHFVLFIVYLFVGSCFLGTLTIGEFTQRFNAGGGSLSRPQMLGVLAFVFSMAALVASTVFGGWHTLLVLTNQTTIEFFHNLSRRAAARSQGYVSVLPWSVGGGGLGPSTDYRRNRRISSTWGGRPTPSKCSVGHHCGGCCCRAR